jgi:hypothetical protein
VKPPTRMDTCGILEIDHALKKRIHQERCLVCRSSRRCDRVNRGTLPCFQPVWLLDGHCPCASLWIEAALGLTPARQSFRRSGRRDGVESGLGGDVASQAPARRTSSDLAQEPESCGHKSTIGLFTAIRDVFRFRGLAEGPALLATHFVFSTWFADCLPLAPCLLITGPRPEGRLLLDLLESLFALRCRLSS